MPEMGESVTEGTVLEWHVAEGQEVAEGDTVIEVSTDKVDAEVPAPAAGVITKLLVAPDDIVKVGQPMAEMSEGRRIRDAPGVVGFRRQRGGRLGRSGGNFNAGCRRWFARDPGCAARRCGCRRRHRSDPGLRRGRQGDEGGRPRCRRRQRRGPGHRRGERSGGRGQAAARPRGDARQGDEREPRRAHGDLVPDRRGRHARRQAQGAQRRAQGARHEGLLHPPDRLGDRQGRRASGR